jgi:hypothetical protein
MDRFRTLLALSTALVCAFGSATFAGTILETAVGNTVSIFDAGVETRYYFNENGSVSQANSNGESDIGTWEAKEGTLCMVWASADAPACIPLSDEQTSIGDTVTVSSPDGTSTDLTILSGKVPF